MSSFCKTYKTIADLDKEVEMIVKTIVKHWYTDWTKYDRPKFTAFKSSTDPDDKELILITRTCGTYLLKRTEADKDGSPENAICEYFRTQERADFYSIDLNHLSIKKIA